MEGLRTNPVKIFFAIGEIAVDEKEDAFIQRALNVSDVKLHLKFPADGEFVELKREAYKNGAYMKFVGNVSQWEDLKALAKKNPMDKVHGVISYFEAGQDIRTTVTSEGITFNEMDVWRVSRFTFLP
eukprot:GHVS01070091.1.p1 GENE.GHVS01070091.1~~GHVS01070091.1.p1  ORF type:complete len:127 (+),score=7.41 GHVS01070091.1:122-502(+)